MKRSFTLALSLLAISFFGSSSFGQGADYRILLNSGEFLPVENAGSLNKNQDVFRKSLFVDRYYLTIQFNRIPSAAEKIQLKAAGISLMDYIPNVAYTASVAKDFSVARLQSFPVRSIFQFTGIQKTIPAIIHKQFPAHAINAPQMLDLSVQTYERMSAAQINASILSIGGQILEEATIFRTFTIRVPQSKVNNLVDLPFIQWVEFIQAPRQQENTLGRTLHRVNVLNDGTRNLKGDGVNVGIWDAGEIGVHQDFLPAGRVTQVEFNSPQQHSTHCAGTILGRGNINPIARGMAANAALYSYNYNGNIQTEMAAAIPANNLIVSSHSYNDGAGVSCNINGTQIQYTLVSRNTDVNLNNFPSHLHVHSAGNSQTSCPSGWYTITGTGKSAKNNIVVAALTSTDGMTSFSSFGPVQDGRVKPEISAFGNSVFSTSTPANSYATLSGTSMSTPGVAGTVTLLVQRYKQLNSNNLPPSTLIKNAVLNTAMDLGNPGPDYRFGYGRINGLGAVRVLEQPSYILNTIANGGNNTSTITVPAGTARLRVMLTWNDPAGAANANPALVNNLDLEVVNGPSTTLPWILDKNNPGSNATRGVDNFSNIEQVTIENPAAATYTVRVLGTSIPSGPQSYALTWMIEQPNIEVVFPNGSETFNPGTSEMITWNNAGVTGNQTVEYSLDNGSSWNTISTVSAATTRVNWTIPSGANTSTALIKITSGAITDQSDATFKIIGTPTGFSGSGVSCNAGEVIFTWSPVTGATHYDIYRLDNITGNFVLLGSNITTTTYTATGLTPGNVVWFTIRAKNNTVNSESERAVAINVTVSSGGGGLPSVGPITGQQSICGVQNNVPYSISAVPGATSYNWTAPPGASIASGQGTTAVTINYPAGSSNGNVSVAASNGSCETAPSTLAVTIGAEPAAPTSGGNQSQTVCPPDPVPTLTATASVPSGHTVKWYNAATGGSVVSNPVLNAPGTITYYAASVNTSSNCESGTRTPVTLTITQVEQATTSASGPTTFCQGGSVVLTANSGGSYLWSNGATTQSITVNTSGSYSVSVTTSGCTTTSTPVAVTVNALPTASVSANGPTSFCQGSSVVLTASGGTSYSWSNGATTPSITVTTSGNYTVTVTNANGCSAVSTTTTVSVSPNPVVTITASPFTALFPGLKTTLTANVTPPPASNYNFVWYRNNVVIPGATSSTLAEVKVQDIGSYTVTVTNQSGLACSNTSPALVIRDSAMTKLFIYPSPNSGRFNVAYHTTGSNVKLTLNVYDSKGAYVFTKTYTQSTPYQLMDVDMRKSRAGVYRVVVYNSTGTKLAVGSVLIQ